MMSAPRLTPAATRYGGCSTVGEVPGISAPIAPVKGRTPVCVDVISRNRSRNGVGSVGQNRIADRDRARRHGGLTLTQRSRDRVIHEDIADQAVLRRQVHPAPGAPPRGGFAADIDV